MKAIQLILIICASVVWLPGRSSAASNVVIQNKTGGVVQFEFKWEGEGSRLPGKDYSLRPGSYEQLWCTYYTSRPPTPTVLFHLHEGLATYGLPWVGFGNQPRWFAIVAVNPGNVSWYPPF